MSHNFSDIILICRFNVKLLLILVLLFNKVWLLNRFETDTFLGFLANYTVQKNSIYLQFCNVLNIFTVTFDQFNASLLGKKFLSFLFFYYKLLGFYETLNLNGTAVSTKILSINKKKKMHKLATIMDTV